VRRCIVVIQQPVLLYTKMQFVLWLCLLTSTVAWRELSFIRFKNYYIRQGSYKSHVLEAWVDKNRTEAKTSIWSPQYSTGKKAELATEPVRTLWWRGKSITFDEIRTAISRLSSSQ
jgi:hypothetical protein